MNETEKAYIAGLTDGEGCISANKQFKKYHYLRVEITNTNPIMCDFLMKTVGYGSPHLVKKQKENWKSTISWIVTNKQGEKFLREILPYLQIKKQLAITGIELRQANQARNTVLAKEIYEKMKLLNKKGATK